MASQDPSDNQDVIDALKQPYTGLKPYPGKGPTVQSSTPFANWAQGMGESGKDQLVGLLKHPENLVGTGELGMIRVPRPVRVWHGSPYDFDKFDMSKIGTGEGGEMIGKGAYVAEHPEVAKRYKEPDTATYKIDDKLYSIGRGWSNPDHDPSVEETAARALHSFGGNKDSAIKYLTSGGGYGPGLSSSGTLHEAQAADFLSNAKNIERYKGRLYEIDMHADPEHFIDYGKEYNEQSPFVKRALDSVWPRKLESGAPVPIPFNDTPALFKAYQNAGIPGTKYFDLHSRIKGEGTRNYVVYNDNLIDIIKKYGIAGLGALPALAQKQETQ